MNLGAWGLTFDLSKRKWKFRPTINRGRKKVGKRITVALSGAVSEGDAIAARDAALGALRAVGLTIHQRHQRRAGANAPTSAPTVATGCSHRDRSTIHQ